MSQNPTIVPPASSSEDRLLFTLDNGLRVVIQEDHFAPVVAIQVWVKTGSADETPDVAGAAHVHEHGIVEMLKPLDRQFDEQLGLRAWN